MKPVNKQPPTGKFGTVAKRAVGEQGIARRYVDGLHVLASLAKKKPQKRRRK